MSLIDDINSALETGNEQRQEVLCSSTYKEGMPKIFSYVNIRGKGYEQRERNPCDKIKISLNNYSNNTKIRVHS